MLPLIHGRIPDSQQEVWYAQALTEMEINFQFQVAIRRGSVAGGYYLDFLVFIPPNQIPVPIYSKHYHRNELSNDEIARLTIIENIYGPASPVWAEEITSKAAAKDLIKERLL